MLTAMNLDHMNTVLFFNYMAKNATDFKFELDVFWVQHGGVDPIELINKYPDFVVLMHLKDMAHGVKGNNMGKEDFDKMLFLAKGKLILQVL